MSERIELRDRIVGTRRAPAPDDLLLGRYQAADETRGLSLNGTPVAPECYLAAGAGRWTLRHGTDRWSGTLSPSALPSAIAVESIALIAGRLTGLQESGAPLAAWTEIPPMVSGISDRLRPSRLETHLRAEFRYLRTVCESPRAQLRTEELLLPVSAARKSNWRTVTHLAAHSETWAARRMHGVEPARLLTAVQVADYDLYENRVVATLLDRLWRHVLTMIAETEKIGSVVAQGQDLIRQAELRPDYRERQRLYTFISQLLMTDDLGEQIEQRKTELAALRQALAVLRAAPLPTAVRGPYRGPARLRPTNIFDHDVGYRHCRQLWDVEVASRRGTDSLREHPVAMVKWCRDFARYALVLITHSLAQLGLAPAGADGPQVGCPGPEYRYRGHRARLDWSRDDTFTLMLDGQPVLRIVPLPHALTAYDDPVQVRRYLDAIGRAAGGGTAILYPGEKTERDALPLDTRLAAHGPPGSTAGLTLVPVSPTDLGSIGRVARMIRVALDTRIMLAYPVPVPVHVAGAHILANEAGWLDWQDGQLRVTRPPRPSEIGRLSGLLAGLRTRMDHARQQGDNHEELSRLDAALRDAVADVTRLTECPVCLRPAASPVSAFKPRDNDTYRCQCSSTSCSAAWEVRRCTRLSCRQRYPVLTIPTMSGLPGGDGDVLDEKFSQDLLAVPCWRAARSYLCPDCGACPESSVANCDWCALQGGTPDQSS
jgi:hypothetical protein